MMSEWLKIMLEEIASKQTAADEAQLEEQRRAAERGGQTPPGVDRATG